MTYTIITRTHTRPRKVAPRKDRIRIRETWHAWCTRRHEKYTSHTLTHTWPRKVATRTNRIRICEMSRTRSAIRHSHLSLSHTHLAAQSDDPQRQNWNTWDVTYIMYTHIWYDIYTYPTHTHLATQSSDSQQEGWNIWDVTYTIQTEIKHSHLSHSHTHLATQSSGFQTQEWNARKMTYIRHT